MNLYLPESLAVGGKNYAIRWDWRAAMEIFAALCDPDLDDQERALTALIILYPELDAIPPAYYAEALQQALRFLNGGAEERDARPRPRLMDWEQDLPLIVGPVSRILGRDVRGAERLHWWTFLSAYMEIGDCTFAQVVGIRKKRLEGRKLSREDRDFLRENRDLIDIKNRYSEAEEAALAIWGGTERK